MRPSDVLDAARSLYQLHEAEERRLERIERALQPGLPDVYLPHGARQTMRDFAAKSRTNYLPLVVDVLAQSMRVVGYRPARASDDSPAWDIWQANGFDARQSGVIRSALRYGTSYVVVVPGDPVPVMRGVAALELTAAYPGDDDDWPMWALRDVGGDAFRLYDDEFVYYLGEDDGEWTFIESREHGLGVCPVVRFRDKMEIDSDLPIGVVEPLIPIQHRIDETVFGLLTAQHFAAFRQRAIIGWEVPKDADGNPVQPLDASVRKVWTFADPDVKVQDLGETDISRYVGAKDSAVRDMSAISQLPPQSFLGAVANMSAEALAAAEAGKDRRAQEIETSLGESFEQMLRLASLADGDTVSAEDTGSEVRWADTTARSLAQAVDALGKAAQMLGVPPQGLWHMIPGVTDQDLQRWEALAAQNDTLGQFAATLDRQTAALMAEPAPPAA